MKKYIIVLILILNLQALSKFFKIKINNKILTKEEKQNLLFTWQKLKNKDEKIIINKKYIFLECSEPTYKNINKIIEKIDKKEKNIQINIQSGITQTENIDIWGINQFGIYNKQNIKKFGFRGIGGTLVDFPEPTEPINNFVVAKHGNTYVNPAIYGINLIDKTVQPRRDSNIDIEMNQLPLTFGGQNLNTKRYSLQPNVYLEDENTKISFNHTFITKNNKTHVLKKEFMLPIYSYKNIDKPDGGIYQKNQIIYVKEGASLQIKAKLKDDNRVTLRTYLTFKSFDLFSRADYVILAKRGVEGSLQFFLTLSPPNFFNTTLYSEATIDKDECLVLLMQKQQKPENLVKKTGFSKLDKLKKLFTSKKKDIKTEYNFILVNVEVLED